MPKVANKQSKVPRKASKNVFRKPLKSRDLRKLQKSRPKRYMNPFLCFAHEERKIANNGHLLADWKAAHKGLGTKWRSLGVGRSKFQRKGKIPAFAVFVKESPKRKEILPTWRKAHIGLGAKWRTLDKSSKAKYVTASKQMKGTYDQHMKAYRNKRSELIKMLRDSRFAKRAAMRQKKMQLVQRKKPKAVRSKTKKLLKRKAETPLKHTKLERTAQR